MLSLPLQVQQGAGNVNYKPLQVLGKITKFFLPLPFLESLWLRSCLGRKSSCKYAAQSWASSFQGGLWERWKTVILSVDTRQPASAGRVCTRCQRWPAYCIIKPIFSAVVLSKRNFGCSCCVETERIPQGSIACSCCELKHVPGLHWEVTETPENVWFCLHEG